MFNTSTSYIMHCAFQTKLVAYFTKHVYPSFFLNRTVYLDLGLVTQQNMQLILHNPIASHRARNSLAT